MQWLIYLSGEIHSDWRERIRRGAEDAGLPVTFTAPVEDHERSDGVGEEILGPEERSFWREDQRDPHAQQHRAGRRSRRALR
jgi:YtoQ family protein